MECVKIYGGVVTQRFLTRGKLTQLSRRYAVLKLKCVVFLDIDTSFPGQKKVIGTPTSANKMTTKDATRGIQFCNLPRLPCFMKRWAHASSTMFNARDALDFCDIATLN